jgi:osomolarity two-component system, sensor histidine kinase TcsA
MFVIASSCGLSNSPFPSPTKACDGVEAVNAVKRFLNQGETLNVIFLDSFMPNMGGIEACKKIRALGYVGVILAISGNVIPEDIQEFLDAGADYFLGKPFKLEQLQSVLSGTSHPYPPPPSAALLTGNCL